MLNDEIVLLHSEYHMFYNRDTIGDSICISQLFLEDLLSLWYVGDINFDNIIVVHILATPFLINFVVVIFVLLWSKILKELPRYFGFGCSYAV